MKKYAIRGTGGGAKRTQSSDCHSALKPQKEVKAALADGKSDQLLCEAGLLVSFLERRLGGGERRERGRRGSADRL